jgi:hypothetical protein
LASLADTSDVSEVRNALLDPLRNVYGVSDKVLSMALSTLLIAAPRIMGQWAEVGYGMIAIDTLVHNFLFRTGILHRFDADHVYGLACYRERGCVDIIQIVAEQINATQFNPRFPMIFPRFVQHAIWRYCAENGLDVCNGNRINDDTRCNNVYAGSAKFVTESRCARMQARKSGRLRSRSGKPDCHRKPYQKS